MFEFKGAKDAFDASIAAAAFKETDIASYTLTYNKLANQINKQIDISINSGEYFCRITHRGINATIIERIVKDLRFVGYVVHSYVNANKENVIMISWDFRRGTGE